MRRGVFHALLVTLGSLVLALPAGAQPAPYKDQQQKDKQEPLLQICRSDLDLELDFDRTDEFGPFIQARALICELEAQARSLGDNPSGPVSAAEAAAHFVATVDRMNVLLDDKANGVSCPMPVTEPECSPTKACSAEGPPPADHDACCDWVLQPCREVDNEVIARQAGLLLAYVLRRNFATFQPHMDIPALLEFGRMLRQPLFDKPLNGSTGNGEIPLFGMRLLGGEASFDPHMTERAEGEFFAAFERVGRGGLAEPTAPHYAGVTISLLTLLRSVGNANVKPAVDKLLDFHFLVPAHTYLPGGGLGAVQNRDNSGGGVTDPNPSDASHLIPQINMFMHDPELPATTGHEPFALGSDYRVPEIIRSIFLAKGGDRGSFRYRESAPTLAAFGWFQGKRDYPYFGWEGVQGTYAAPRRTVPWEALLVGDGEAELGVRHGEVGAKDNTSGLYLRKPNSDPPAFSILYHRLPRPHPSTPTQAPNPAMESEWDRERSKYNRRMVWGDTAVTLWDRRNQAPPPGEFGDPNEILLEYTEVHLPDFCEPGQVVANECDVFPSAIGNDWYLARSGKAYVAFLPLGDLDPAGPVDYGDWIYLKLESETSGDVIVLGTDDEYNDLAAFRADIESRFVSFTGLPEAEVEFDTRDEIGNTTRLRLSYQPEERAITVDPTDPLAVEDILDDAEYFPDKLVESPWVSWDESQGSFELTISRYGQNVVYDFGSTTQPTTPANPELVSRDPDGTTTLRWDQSWDDVGITAYKVNYHDYTGTPFGGQLLATITEPPPPGWANPNNRKATTVVQGPADDPFSPCQRKVRFSIRAFDGSEHSRRAYVTDVPVYGDGGLAPHMPTGLAAIPANEKNAIVWKASHDECGIQHYRVFRNGVLVANTTNTSYSDTATIPGVSYVYSVQAVDTGGNLSPQSGTVMASHCVTPDPDHPSAPTNVQAEEDAYGRSATISWGASTDDCALFGYVVWRDGNFAGLVSEEEFRDTTIAPGNEYIYSVTAYDFDGHATVSPTTPQLVVPPDTELPDAPVEVTGVANGADIDLSWEAGYDYWGLDRYEVLRDGLPIATIQDPAQLSFTDVGAAPGPYSYVIRAVDTADNASDSTPTLLPPPAP